MSNTMKWAFVGDLQIPFHDKRAVALFFKVMKSWKPDVIDIVGDIDDQLEYSTFSDGTTDEFFNQIAKNEKENAKLEELNEKTKYMLPPFQNPHDLAPVNPMPFVVENAKGANQFYTDLRKQHMDTEIHSSLGNHDIRVFKYINKKAPDYYEQITPNTLWGLDDLGITWRMYDDPPLERHAGIFVHHGATVTDTGLAVKNDILNYGISLVRGHDHRGGVVYKRYDIANRALVGMGTGHLCDEKSWGMKYTINHSWEKGFGIGHVYDGFAWLQFIRIDKDYRCVVDGKLFEG